jgi:hypothetical protein
MDKIQKPGNSEFRDNLYFLRVNRTLFPASGACCLGYVSAHVCHLQVWILITVILSYTWRKFFV